MVCAGGWQAETITQFQAAVSINHMARGHKGLYEEKCGDCIATLNDRYLTPVPLLFNGCMRHLGNTKKSL
jgi:hypothetical protein